MSTPYVGIKRVSQNSRFFGQAAWIEKPVVPAKGGQPDETSSTVPFQQAAEQIIKPDNPAPAQEREDIAQVETPKQCLIRLLKDHAGVEAIQVGSFIMALTEAVPTRHLILSTRWLIAEWQGEQSWQPLIDTLEPYLAMLEGES